MTTEELQVIRMLRYSLASIWTALEYDCPDKEQAVADARRIASQALDMTVGHARPGKDLTDDGRGMEGWRQHVDPDGKIIKEFW